MKRILTITIIVLAVILDLFFLPWLQSPWLGTTFTVPALMLVALFGAPMTALVSGFVCGFLFDLVGPYPFGSFLIAYLFAIEIVLWLSYTRFTNRSLLSLLTLISIGTLCFEIVCIVLTTVLHLLQPNTIALHMNQAWIVWSSWNIARNICITAVSYFIVRSFGTSYAILSQRSMSG